VQFFEPGSKKEVDIEKGKNFFEIKRYGKYTMDRYHNDYQIAAQIDVIAYHFSGAAKDNAAFYYLVTTADLYDVSDIAEYAYEKNVNFYHVIAQYKVLKSGDVKVRFITRSYDNIFNTGYREKKFAYGNNKGVALVPKI